MDNPKKADPPSQPTQKGVEHRRLESFISKYANNVFIESSTWDMKLNFGELDQALGENVVVQHTGITLPWTYVKLLAYLLQVNLLGHEATHGRVIVPKGLIAPVPDKRPSNVAIDEESFAAVKALYKEFISKNPEAAPDYEPAGSKGTKKLQ